MHQQQQQQRTITSTTTTITTSTTATTTTTKHKQQERFGFATIPAPVHFLHSEITLLLWLHDANPRSHKNLTKINGDSFFQNSAAPFQKNNVSIVV